jgi:hypothetical protein
MISDALAVAIIVTYCAGVGVTVALLSIGEARRQRRYRDALNRMDWAEAHRLMGFDE